MSLKISQNTEDMILGKGKNITWASNEVKNFQPSKDTVKSMKKQLSEKCKSKPK